MSVASTEKAAIARELLALGARLPAVRAVCGPEVQAAACSPMDAPLEELQRAVKDATAAARVARYPDTPPGKVAVQQLYDQLALSNLAARARRLEALPVRNPEAERIMADIRGDETAEGDAVRRFRYGSERERDQARVELAHLAMQGVPRTGPLQRLIVDLLKHGEIALAPARPRQRTDQVALIAFAHGSGLALSRCYRLADLLWPTTENGPENLRQAFRSARKKRAGEIEEMIERGKKSPGYGERELRRLESPRNRENP